MEDSPSFDINLNTKSMKNDFITKKRLIFNFFYSTKCVTKYGQKFSINTLKYNDITYSTDKLHLTNNVSLTFYTCKNDDRPFVLCLEKMENKLLYYGLECKKSYLWDEINDATLSNENEEDDMLLYLLKTQYAKYFESVLKVDDDVIFNLQTKYEDITYDLAHSVFYDHYDKYHFKPNKAHSLHGIRLFGRDLVFERSLNFVQDVYLYYVNYDLTTPLMIETVDFKIGDKTPLIRYYIEMSVNSRKWIEVYPQSSLVYPKCDGDLGRVLISIVLKYQNYPVEMNVTMKRSLEHVEHSTKFSGLSFYFGHLYNLKYGCLVYYPRVGNTFLLASIRFDNKLQYIEVEGREYRHVYFYYSAKLNWKPILICFGLKTNTLTLRYIWYINEEGSDDRWKRFDCDASPYTDHDFIENVIEKHFGTEASMKSIATKTFWISVFTLGTVVGTCMGVYFSERVIGSFGRFFNRIRRLVVR